MLSFLGISHERQRGSSLVVLGLELVVPTPRLKRCDLMFSNGSLLMMSRLEGSKRGEAGGRS